MIRLIAAIDRRLGLAKQGLQPWYIPDDEVYFTERTKTYGANCLTGSTTFKTFKHGPLAERNNYILTHDKEPIEGATLVNDLTAFLQEFDGKDLWVVGGANVFSQVMELGQADELYLTEIEADFGCNQFFPAFEQNFTLSERSDLCEQNGFIFTVAKYVKKTT